MASEPQPPAIKAPEEIKSTEALNNLIKSLRTSKGNSESGSSNGGDHSDNSALVSLGNTSFGFNFDSEEGCSNNSKEGQNDSNEDSDGNGQSDSKNPTVSASSASASKKRTSTPQLPQTSNKEGNGNSDEMKSTTSSLSSSTNSNKYNNAEQNEAAANAVANLASIARSYPKSSLSESTKTSDMRVSLERKRKEADDKDADSGGYNTDDDEQRAPSRISGVENNSKGGAKSRKKKREENEHKREERNQREKERSFRISKQITDLRNLLSSGGVVVPKGTKSSVLTEAANYIRMLQQHQYRSEIDRYQLVQQMQTIGSGAHGEQAATAVRHYAAQNGVWTLGNFGGVPPKSAMTFAEPPTTVSQDASDQPQQPTTAVQSSKVDASEYRFIFNSCGAGMAISSMGGAFIDCNQLFCQLSNYTKQEICSLTLFNLTARQDLQQAFDQISRMISPPMDADQNEQRVKPIILRGAMKNRDDLGMSVSLVKGDDGIAKCFCVTLVKNPSSPFDTSKPVPVSFESIQSPSTTPGESCSTKAGNGVHTAPAFTAG